MQPTLEQETLDSINPATGDSVGSVPITPVGDITAMVTRAREAQKAWAALGLKERAERLRPAADALIQAAEGELGELITREMGKPIREARGEILSCGKSLSGELDEIIEALEPETLEDKRTTSHVYHDPFGVCVAISPWNFPVAMPHSLVIPALMAGNSVILKPSEETPLSGDRYASILSAALPDGVLQVVHGADAQGKALVQADIDLIAFTGSRGAGKHILGSAAGGLKRVILELGGKDPLVVLKDADLEAAAKFATANGFRNAGQVCVSTERVYVDESVATEFEEILARYTGDAVMGNGFDDETRVGPMVNSRQRDHVLAQVDSAIKAGARVVAGGANHPEGFVRPTVLAGVDHDMDIMREETFGPVICVQTFATDDEAVTLANDTPFGLGAAVYGAEDHALAVARRLDAGMIGVNKSCGGASGSPWVGAKQSGYGYHSSRDGHRQFAQARVVSVPKS